MSTSGSTTRPVTSTRGARVAGLAALLVLGALVAVPAPWSSGRAETRLPGDAGSGDRPAAAERAREAYGRLPLRFEANRGQSAPEVQYLARGAGYTAFLTGREAVLRLAGPVGSGPGAEVRMSLAGADPAAPVSAATRLPGVSNYLRGDDPPRWVTGVPSYGRVRYAGVYPGIDLVYHGSRRQLEYDFVVAPGADPGRIAIDLRPATGLVIDEDGDLVVSTPAGEVRHRKPVVYQEIDGRRRTVPAAFEQRPDGRIGFRVGRYDAAHPLVIDPAVIYSTLLGGLGADSAAGIAVDGGGSAYVTGQTAAADFPLAAPLQGTRRGASDAFVTKLNAAGTGLVYSTFLGGADVDNGLAIAVDGGGSAYVTGETRSNDFPTAGPIQAARGGGTCGTAPNTFPCPDAFVAKLNPAGSALVYSTYLGGATSDVGRGIAVDPAGNAHVTGDAGAGYPTTNPIQAAPGGGVDAFVTKLNAAGSARVYSTFLGGSGTDAGRAIALDPGGNAYVTGEAGTGFPTTGGAFQAAPAGGSDAFVVKLDPAGTSRLYSTYLGGAAADVGRGIAVEGAGDAYVVGSTASADFPTASPLQGAKPGGDDGFVTKVNNLGTGLLWSTYLGGLGPDDANAVAVSSGSAHVAGTTSSTDFPTAAPVSARAGSSDAFVVQFAAAGNALVHGAPYGGNAGDSGAAIAVDTSGASYLAGQSSAFTEGDFPLVQPFQAASGGASDGFVAKVAPTAAAVPLVTGLSPRSGPPGTQVVITGSGFTAQSTVRFGTVAVAGFTVVSPTEIRALAPSHPAGTVAVVVTNAGGTSPANPITRFTYAEGTWELTGPQVVARVATRSVLMADGRVLLVGGRDRQGGAALASAEVYDPRTNAWALTGSMADARTAHTATLLPNGRILVTGGATGNLTTNAQPQLNTAELFDPATGTWSRTGPMAVPRYLHSAILLRDGRVLVAGGRTCNAPPPTACDFTQFTNTAEIFDPATGRFEATGSMSVPRHTTDATLLNDGRVMIPAGFGGPPTGHNSADVFDPRTGTWSPTGPMSVGRSRQGAVTLRDGRVLVANGFSGGNSAEVWDPATNQWTLTGAPSGVGRNNHFMGLLPNGRVLVAGGGPGGVTAEVFDPSVNRWRSAGTMHVSRGIAGTPYNTVKPVVLSSDPTTLEADPAVCGNNCLKVLLAGETEDRRAQLYLPEPAVPTDKGYWTVASDGGIFAFGNAQFYGSTGALRLNRPVVGMAATPSGRGYWLVASDGGIFAFGDAQFHGSTGNLRLNQPVVGMAPTPSGRGYWLVAADGGLFAFGDAQFFGSTGGIRLNRPVVGMAATHTGRGYWLVASDGGIFAFGDARFHGSTGALRLNRPVVGMARTTTSKGYTLVASDGGIFAFGDARFLGSTGAIRLNQPMVGMAPTPSPSPLTGYWLVASDGGIFAFGDAPFLGSTGAIRLNRPMVGMAPVPRPR